MSESLVAGAPHPSAEELKIADAQLAELHARRCRLRIEAATAGTVDVSGLIAASIRDALEDRVGWCSAVAIQRNGGRCLRAGPALAPEEPCPNCGIPRGDHLGANPNCQGDAR